MHDWSADVGEERWLEVAPSMRIFYRRYGEPRASGTPVVCLPGYWRNSSDFDALASHLAHARRVITPDMRGRGRSDRSRDEADYAFEALLGDVEKLLDEEAIERAVFVGTALGAFLAMTLAVKRPELVAGLVLNDTGTESPSAAASAKMVHFAGGDEFTFSEAMVRIREQNEPQFPAFGDAEWERMTRRAYREQPSGKWARDFDQLTNSIFPAVKARHPDWWPEFKGADKAPVAILRGEHSQYLSPELAERMVAAHPHASLHVIRGSGHAPTLWEPDALAAVDDLLSKVDGQAERSGAAVDA